MGRILARAEGPGFVWSATFGLSALESALRGASDGIDGDLDIASETVPVKVEGDTVEIPIGPFAVTGTLDAWAKTVERERDEALPLSQCPATDTPAWDRERYVFPVSSVE